MRSDTMRSRRVPPADMARTTAEIGGSRDRVRPSHYRPYDISRSRHQAHDFVGSQSSLGRRGNAGKVRGGFTEAEARDLRERLDPFIRKDSPLSEPVTKPKATWVEPVIEAEVAYSTLTENNLLREAVFKGVREDRE
jgi:ATP-dependent DNA ligase